MLIRVCIVCGTTRFTGLDRHPLYVLLSAYLVRTHHSNLCLIARYNLNRRVSKQSFCPQLELVRRVVEYGTATLIDCCYSRDVADALRHSLVSISAPWLLCSIYVIALSSRSARRSVLLHPLRNLQAQSLSTHRTSQSLHEARIVR